MARYEITEDGKVLEEGKEVGRFNEHNELILNKGAEVSGQAQSYLERKHKSQEIGVVEPPEDDLPPATKKVMEKKADEEAEEDKGPKQDPRMGDKTPAYAKWLAKNKPEEFKKRYAGRKVMGVQLPPVIKEIPKFPEGDIQPIGGDVPESSMAKEAKEQWL